MSEGTGRAEQGSAISGKWNITVSGQRGWSVGAPSGFANWQLPKTGSYPPTAAGRQRPHLQVSTGTNSEFSQQPWAFSGTYFKGQWGHPWAVRNCVGVRSSLHRTRLKPGRGLRKAWLELCQVLLFDEVCNGVNGSF